MTKVMRERWLELAENWFGYWQNGLCSCDEDAMWRCLFRWASGVSHI